MSADESIYDELLGAYALDALDDDERRAVDEYLQVNPGALAEVHQHREVATMLAWTTMAPPDGLWDRIAASLDEEAPVPRGELAKVLPLARRERPRWLLPAVAWVAASAAAAAVAVLVVGAIGGDPSPSSPLAAAVAEARADRDARVTTLVSADGKVQVPAVIDGDGHGFLEAQALPDLPADRTYQLWGVVGDQVISLGVIGGSPTIAPFSVDGDVVVAALVITNEVAGGVVSDGNPEGAFVGTLG
jgi:anti-sigma factor RsiW